MGKKILAIVIVLVVAALAGFALLHSGLPPTHDGEYHVVRFYEFNKAIADGSLYPRWAPDLNNGYGVPLFNYVYPLPNYIAAALHLIGFSFIESFKLIMFLSILAGGVFFYLWSREFWGELGGVVSSVFYTLAPYHFVDIYIRGSVGEVLALAIFPAFLWSLTVFVKTRNQLFLPLSGLFLALLVLSHNILALMFCVFALFYVALLLYKKKSDRKLLIQCILIVVLGLGLSSIFWLPALFEKNYVVGLEVYDVASNFPLLYQLLIPTWGSGFAGGNLRDELSFQIGIANLLAVFLSGLFIILNRKRDNKKSWILFFLCWFFFVFFLMLKSSQFIWENIPLMNYFQFPWRLLSLEILISSFLAGGVVYFGRARKFLAGALIIVAILLGIGYAKPAHYFNRSDTYYTSRDNFIFGTNSPGNAFNTIWFKGLEKNKNKLSLLEGSADIKITKIKSSNYLAEISAEKESKIVVNTAYFPGWAVFVNDKKTEIRQTKEGLFYFNIPKGKHSVGVKLEDTMFQRAGVLGFYASGLVLLVLFGRVIFVTIKK